MRTRQPVEATRHPAGTPRLVINPIACDGIGMCAHLAPTLISLDTWGYPKLPSTPLQRTELRAATAATSGCPRKALSIKEDARPAPLNG